MKDAALDRDFFTEPADKIRWQKILARTPDAHFVLAVKTTGIYCLSHCPARHPYPQNICFFPDAAAAEKAGFRACKRCKPDQSAEASQPHAKAIKTACQILKNSDEPISLAALAAQLGLSPSYFQRIFKKSLGLSPKDYAKAQRRDRFAGQLQKGVHVTEALYEAGFHSASAAYKATSLGMAPARYKKGGAGEVIFYGEGLSDFGPVFAATTQKGICMLAFASFETGLEDLKKRFPHAELLPGDRQKDRHFEKLLNRTIDALTEPEKAKSLPLDIRGTAFQARVWQALQHIPYGTTIDYSTLASQIEQPSAARAVASACARNEIAVLIPCHRVVQKTGALSGYRWDPARKKALLAYEKKHAQTKKPRPD